MWPRPLPRNPNLRLINDQAKDLLQEFRQGNAPALVCFSHFDALPDNLNPTLADARHIIAREYGHASWPELKHHVDALTRESDSLEELVGL
jgi:hypothetical protein